jgi:hypothetical protein
LLRARLNAHFAVWFLTQTGFLCGTYCHFFPLPFAVMDG